MIRLWLLFAVVLLSGAPVWAAEPVYRNFVWGVAPDDVRHYETAMLYDEKDDTLSFFEDTKSGRKVYRYDFNDNKLWRIRVSYQELSLPYIKQNLDVVIDEENALKRQFGAPVRDQLIWKNQVYRHHAKLFERAFAMGHVVIESEWQKGDTNVLLKAYGNSPYYELGYVIENRAAAPQNEFQILPFTFNE